MSKIGDRIKDRRKTLGYTVDELALKIGKNRATIYRHENGDITGLPADILNPLSNALNTTPAYLLGYDEEKSSSHPRAVRIPVLGQVAAGIPCEAIENIVDWEEIPEEMARSGKYYGLKVKGQSMEPRICDGDVVIVKRQETCSNGDIAIVSVNGDEATMKKVKIQEDGITLIANNLAVYEPHFYSNKEIESLPIQIWGVVIELRGKF